MLIWSIAATPQIRFVASPSTVPVGRNTLLTCTITAEPAVNSSQIVRIIPNREPDVLAEEPNSDGVREFEVTYIFNRVNFPKDDGAEFQCRATNDNGLATQNIMITVQGELYIGKLVQRFAGTDCRTRVGVDNHNLYMIEFLDYRDVWWCFRLGLHE